MSTHPYDIVFIRCIILSCEFHIYFTSKIMRFVPSYFKVVNTTYKFEAPPNCSTGLLSRAVLVHSFLCLWRFFKNFGAQFKKVYLFTLFWFHPLNSYHTAAIATANRRIYFRYENSGESSFFNNTFKLGGAHRLPSTADMIIFFYIES